MHTELFCWIVCASKANSATTVNILGIPSHTSLALSLDWANAALDGAVVNNSTDEGGNSRVDNTSATPIANFYLKQLTTTFFCLLPSQSTPYTLQTPPNPSPLYPQSNLSLSLPPPPRYTHFRTLRPVLPRTWSWQRTRSWAGGQTPRSLSSDISVPVTRSRTRRSCWTATGPLAMGGGMWHEIRVGWHCYKYIILKLNAM